MTCTSYRLGDGGFAIVCTRGRPARATCSACGTREHELLCDYPLRGKKAGKTCSRKLCSACAVKVGDLDYCPAHAKLPAAPAQPAAPPRARIFDHLEGAPEDRQFSRVAHAMHASSWWSSVPERDEPVATAGEVG